MKIIGIFLIALFTVSGLRAQTEERDLPPFTKIIASQYINVVLQKGNQESIKLLCSGVDEDKVNVKIKGSKLHIYLDNARLVDKGERIRHDGYSYRRSMYAGASVTAYITYRELKGVEMRGETELFSDEGIEADKFKLKAYGETEINIASLQARKFKASLYGANKVKIKDGEAGDQLYRLFGENKIDAGKLLSNTTTTRIYGEGIVNVLAIEEFRVTAFGEPELQLNGTGRLSKGIIIGEPSIRKGW